MTPVQKQVLDCIKSHHARTGLTPTYDEIAGALGIKSKSTVFHVVNRLAEGGHVRRTPNRARSIEIVDKTCPHCGGKL